MKIWFINQYATTPQSTGGNRPFSLCRELVARGHDVVLVACTFNHQTKADEFPQKRWTYATQEVEGVRFVWIDAPAYVENDLHRVQNMLVFTWRILRLATEDSRLPPPDVVLGSSPHLLVPLAAQRLATHFDVPFVMEVRDIWPASVVELQGMRRSSPIVLALGQLERFVCTRASEVVSVLPGGVNHLVEIGVDADRVTWIPNGVDFNLVPPPTPLPDRDMLTLMFAGSHGVSDGLDVMIEAASQLEASDAGRVRWRFIGNGPYKATMIDEAERRGLTNVTFEDAVPKREIYGRLSEADAFVVTVRDEPLYRFGVSFNKFYDYMAMARPTLIAMDSPWNPFEESESGSTVRPDDAGAFADGVLELLSLSWAEREAMGARGRAFVEQKHDFRDLAGALEVVLERATGR